MIKNKENQKQPAVKNENAGKCVFSDYKLGVNVTVK